MDYERRVLALWGAGMTGRTPPRWVRKLEQWRDTSIADMLSERDQITSRGPLFRAVLISGSLKHGVIVIEARTVDALGVDAWVEVNEEDENWVDFLAAALSHQPSQGPIKL